MDIVASSVREVFLGAYSTRLVYRNARIRSSFASGRFGDHSLRLLREIATRGVDDGFLLPPTSWLSFNKARLVSYWVDLWLQDISLSLAHHLTSLVVEKLCN